MNVNNIPPITDFNRTTVVDKTTPTTPTPSLNEGILKPIKPEDIVIPNNTNIDVSQYKVYDNDDDAYNDFLNKSQQPKQNQQVKQPKQVQQVDPMLEINDLYDNELLAYGKEEASKRKNKRVNKLTDMQESDNNQQESVNQVEIRQEIKYEPVQQIDPFKMMFSTFKRNHEVVFNVQFKDKIANPDFIKMMMENMDGDIIGFYKKSIMDNIMKNLTVIESVVEKELRNILGEEDVEIDNDILEIKTETKITKKTRKPYTKKTTK